VKIVDPFAQVDNVLLPYTDLEMRKIERLGKVQRKRYLKNRDEKRESLILQEEVRQEKRLQDCYSRLFRVHLILAAQEMSPAEGEDLFTASSSSFPSSSSKPRSSRKAFSSSSISSAKSGMSSTVPGGGGDRQIIEENLLKAHISLRAAFRAFHPQRMEAYVNILVYAHDVLIKLLVRVYNIVVLCCDTLMLFFNCLVWLATLVTRGRDLSPCRIRKCRSTPRSSYYNSSGTCQQTRSGKPR
jgi:hypothetical protein